MTGLMGAAGLNDIWVALIALCGTVIGSFSGIIVSNKLVNYRLEQLEKKVEKHNNVIERLYKLERQHEVLGEKVKSVAQRLGDLEMCV
jgi:membrane protein YqaA with SNARE-associated domain